MKLRSYQIDAIHNIRQCYREGARRPILQSATGSGKTLIAVEIIKSALAKGKRVYFLIDRIILADQTSATFTKHGLDHGIIQGDNPLRNDWLNLQIASIQTLTRRRGIQKPDFVIIDECHSTFESLTKLLKTEWADVPVLGLSATPFTKGLGLIYDKLSVAATTGQLIQDGYLSNYEAYGPTKPDLKGVRTVAGDYNTKQLSGRCQKITGDVCDSWRRLGQNRQTLAFAVDVAHSEAIVKEFTDNGISAAHIDAYTSYSERVDVLAKHESGEIKVVSNVGILTKGFDSPNSSCLIYARPTKSLSLHIQMLGRILRVSERGEEAIIIDHGGNLERLGFPDDQLPEFLDHGEKDEAAEKKEREEKLPTPCEACSFLSAEFICPQCGHKPEKKTVEVEAGELKKLKRDDTTPAQKLQDFGEFLGYVRSKGKKDGMASHLYRELYGCWPYRKTGVPAVQPSQRILDFITSRNIRYAKRKTA